MNDYNDKIKPHIPPQDVTKEGKLLDEAFLSSLPTHDKDALSSFKLSANVISGATRNLLAGGVDHRMLIMALAYQARRLMDQHNWSPEMRGDTVGSIFLDQEENRPF